MLTWSRVWSRPVAAWAALCLCMAAACVVLAAPADAAGGCVAPAVPGPYNPITKTYTCVKPGSSSSGTDGSSTSTGPSTPSCDLEAANDLVELHADENPGSPYCSGTETCILMDHGRPWADPPGEPPNKNTDKRVQWCKLADGGVRGLPVWEGEEEPSLLEQARTAVGQIVLPAPELSTSPVNRTLVNLDTWFWVDGQPEDATGSSAFGLVAIATFGSLQIDPGDGSGVMDCPLTTTEEDAERDCTHEYTSSSRGASASVDGRPAFPVTATITYDLRFEVDGAPVDIDGAPATLGGPTGEVALRVDEVQSTVTGLR